MKYRAVFLMLGLMAVIWAIDPPIRMSSPLASDGERETLLESQGRSGTPALGGGPRPTAGSGAGRTAAELLMARQAASSDAARSADARADSANTRVDFATTRPEAHAPGFLTDRPSPSGGDAVSVERTVAAPDDRVTPASERERPMILPQP